MSDPVSTTADQLDSLLREGKISESEYERLRQALETRSEEGPGSVSKPPSTRRTIFRQLPAPLWVGLISLGIIVLLKIAAALKMALGVGLVPLMLIDAALSAGLLVGLYLGHRWAYVLTIVFCILGTALGFRAGLVQGLLTLVLDCLVLVPVLLSTRYFFPHVNTEMGENET